MDLARSGSKILISLMLRMLHYDLLTTLLRAPNQSVIVEQVHLGLSISRKKKKKKKKKEETNPLMLLTLILGCLWFFPRGGMWQGQEKSLMQSQLHGNGCLPVLQLWFFFPYISWLKSSSTLKCWLQLALKRFTTTDDHARRNSFAHKWYYFCVCGVKLGDFFSIVSLKEGIG